MIWLYAILDIHTAQRNIKVYSVCHMIDSFFFILYLPDRCYDTLMNRLPSHVSSHGRTGSPAHLPVFPSKYAINIPNGKALNLLIILKYNSV